jgi:hypothetical protein
VTPHKIPLDPERLAAAEAVLAGVELSRPPAPAGARRRPLDDERDPNGKPHLYVGEDATGEKCDWCGFGKSHDIHSTERRKAWQKENRIVPDMDVNWQGDPHLQRFLVPIAELKVGTAVGDLTAVALGLAKDGQLNEVLTAEDGRSVAKRAHIVHAAAQLGWTHVAARRESAVRSIEDHTQVSLLDEAEIAGDDTSFRAMARVDDSLTAEDVNSQTAQANRIWEWAGLAEFIQAEDTYKVIVSCRSEEERQALLDSLGVAAAYQRKRGPISAMWPDYGRESPTALRFESEDRPDGGKPMEKP